MPLDWNQQLAASEAETSGDTFATLIAAAERSLRYADEARSSMVAIGCLWSAHDDLSEARHLAPSGCCRLFVTDAARRCGEAASSGGRSVGETLALVRLLQP